MTLRLYDTMRRAVVDFEPLAPPRVTLYTCGPTVYNYAHVGNFRTFLFEDLLRRWLEARGHDVFHVMNLTDVDDKTIRGALAAGRPLREHVEQFVTAFHEDRDWLGILPPHAEPRATDFVPQMIALVESLLAKGVAYRGEDGSVYFSIARFPGYGRLSRLDARELRAGAGGRVSADEYAKEDAQDFVLWKAAREEDERVGAAWDTPFGRGRPGWHLECSAMALSLIGDRFGARVLDIHAGGVDLVFPHHEDEIAQSCAHTGQAEFARFWMHGEFLNIRGSKMSKRFGNVTTARDLREDGVPPQAFRLLVCTTHYRQALDLTDEALESAREGSRRLGDFGARLVNAIAAAAGVPEAPTFVEAANRFEAAFGAALDDDLNAPQALGALFDFAREGNRLLDARDAPGARAAAAWALEERVLGVATPPGLAGVVRAGPSRLHGELTVVLPESPPAERAAADDWATGWAHRRLEAKGRRDYAEADRIRGFLGAAGYEVRDRKDGAVEVVYRGS